MRIELDKQEAKLCNPSNSSCELTASLKHGRAIKGVGKQANNTVKERCYYHESRQKLGIRRATRETATPHCRFRLDISCSVKLIQGEGGRKGKETEGNRRDLIMARNEDGRFARAAVFLKLKRHLRSGKSVQRVFRPF